MSRKIFNAASTSGARTVPNFVQTFVIVNRQITVLWVSLISGYLFDYPQAAPYMVIGWNGIYCATTDLIAFSTRLKPVRRRYK